MVFEGSSIISLTLQAINMGVSSIAGAYLSSSIFMGVKLQASNLSISLPDFTPQKSAAFTSSSLTKFTTNSLVSISIAYEYLSGVTDIESIGGFEFTTPTHAIVIML